MIVQQPVQRSQSQGNDDVPDGKLWMRSWAAGALHTRAGIACADCSPPLASNGPAWATIPNYLSGLRLLLIPVLWLVALMNLPGYVGIGLILAGLTDCLDGFLARRCNRVTAFGSKLDSLADNLLIPSTIVWVFLLRPEIPAHHPVLTLTTILVYAAALLVGGMKFRRFANLHLYSSKAAGVIVYIFVVHAFLFSYHPGLFYLAMGMFLLSSIEVLILQLTRSHVDEHIGSIVLGFKDYIRSHSYEP
jgi:phosphatidylglycerophosphate synthase